MRCTREREGRRREVGGVKQVGEREPLKGEKRDKVENANSRKPTRWTLWRKGENCFSTQEYTKGPHAVKYLKQSAA